MSTPQPTPAQYAIQALELANNNLGKAIALMGQEPSTDDLMGVAHIQVEVAKASALLDVASALRQANPSQALFAGLQGVSRALEGLSGSQEAQNIRKAV